MIYAYIYLFMFRIIRFMALKVKYNLYLRAVCFSATDTAITNLAISILQVNYVWRMRI